MRDGALSTREGWPQPGKGGFNEEKLASTKVEWLQRKRWLLQGYCGAQCVSDCFTLARNSVAYTERARQMNKRSRVVNQNQTAPRHVQRLLLRGRLLIAEVKVLKAHCLICCRHASSTTAEPLEKHLVSAVLMLKYTNQPAKASGNSLEATQRRDQGRENEIMENSKST